MPTHFPFEYPRTYRVDTTARHFMIGFGIFLVSLGLFMSVLHVLGIMKRPFAANDAVADIFFVCLAILISSRVSRRVIVYDNAIEVVGWFSRRKIMREEIQGYRMGRLPKQAGASYYYIIVPLDEHARELKLPPFLHYDKPFLAWIRVIPHLKA